MSEHPKTAPPPIPVTPLGGAVAEMVSAVAKGYQVPPELPLLGALATLSAAALKRVVVRIRDGWREQVALYVAPIAEPGERKTGALSSIARPLRDLERRRAKELEPLVTESQREHADAMARVAALATKAAKATKGREAILDELRHARADLDQLGAPMVAPRWFADDATPEALGRCIAAHDGRMAIFASEGGLFETLAGRYSNGVANLDLVLKAWDGAEPWIYDRVGLHLRIAEPLLTLCMFVQPDVLTALADKQGFRGRGFVGRWIFAVPTSLMGSRDVDPSPLPARVDAAWRAIVERVASLEDRRSETGELAPREIGLDRQAREALLDYAREVEARLGPDGDLRPCSDWAGKHVGTVARIAGLLHLADAAGNEGRDIPRSTMERAIELGRALVPHAVEAIRRMGGGRLEPTDEIAREANALIEWLRANPDSSASDIAHGGPRRYRGDAPAVERALAALVAAEIVCGAWSTPTGGGRPAYRYSIATWSGAGTAADDPASGSSCATQGRVPSNNGSPWRMSL